MGAGIGGMTFMTNYNLMTNYLYGDPQYADIDFRVKNMAIYLSSDILASLIKVPFETRKQLLQMANSEIPLEVIVKNTYRGIMPMVVRDTSFRFILLSVYYGTTNVEHKPMLKYTIPQIMEFKRIRREQGYNDSFADIQSTIYEYHNYSIKTKFTTRLTMLILANLFGTFITNPIDVCLTKILTQNPDGGPPKYNGLIHALRTVYKEEGHMKFLSGVHPRFMFNLINGFLFLFVYDRFIHYVNTVYEQ